MNIPILDLKRQYAQIAEELEPKVLECMRGGAYIQGPQVAALEQELCAFLGVRHVITVGNGTDALVISLRALGIGAGDEVITTPFSYFATAESIAAVGATPVFADVDGKTYNIDPESIRKKITPRTRAILPVHIFGQPADMESILAIVKEHGLKVLEDAAQAFGAEYRGKKAGTLGDLGCYSFFPTKNLGCFGDGGAIVTDDDDLAVVCRALREHCGGKNGARARGIRDGAPLADEDEKPVDPLYNPYKYFNYMIGFNSRLDALQAVVLRVKLRHLEEWNRRRAAHAAAYCEALAGADVGLPEVLPGVMPIWHQFAIRTAHKKELGEWLSRRGIVSGVFYPVPLHLQKAFDYLGGREGDLPAAEELTRQSLCLPVYPELTGEELACVAEAVKSFAG